MNRGHLLAVLVMIAFSTEKSSEGSCHKPHCLISTGSPSTLLRLNVPELGMALSVLFYTQMCDTSSLYTELNAPK